MSFCHLIRYFFVLTFCAESYAATSNWTESDGNTFKGEPQCVYGPFALFKTGSYKGRRVLLRNLSPQECVRFYNETQGKGEAAVDWSEARSELSADFKGSVLRLDKDRLAGVNFKGVPEPELYVLLFASSWESRSYMIPWWYLPTYNRLRRLYGNRMETVFFGVRHDGMGNFNLAKATLMPWLVADYNSQSSIGAFERFAPAQGLTMTLVTRQGIPVAGGDVDTVQGMKKFIDQLNVYMALGDELNSVVWPDRAYYLANIRPVQYADKTTPPLLVGNPLRASTLRANKIGRLAAKMDIAADGSATNVTIENRQAIPPALADALEKVMKTNFVFVPAIDHGKPVAASYDFEYAVPDEKQAMEADRGWVFMANRKEISIPRWLLLSPIPVPAIEFSQVDHVDEEGKYVMTAVKVGTEVVSHRAQMNAFNCDFFEKAGAASVRPAAGQAQEIDDHVYTWKACDSADGFVDLRNNTDCDHSVGYAWAEFEVPEGGWAYFGLGSDDGVKIWLNGKLVHDRWVQRITQIDEDIVPLQLIAGKNTILIKIQNAKGDWSFFFRLRR